MVHQFNDTEGRVWHITLDIAAARRLRQAGHDIVDFEAAADTLPNLFTDEIALGEALYAICLPQAESRDIGEDAFLAALGGESAGKAREALLAALPDFFTGPKRDAISAMVEQMRRTLADQVRTAIVTMTESPGDESTDGSERSDSPPPVSPSGS